MLRQSGAWRQTHCCSGRRVRRPAPAASAARGGAPGLDDTKLFPSAETYRPTSSRYSWPATPVHSLSGRPWDRRLNQSRSVASSPRTRFISSLCGYRKPDLSWLQAPLPACCCNCWDAGLGHRVACRSESQTGRSAVDEAIAVGAAGDNRVHTDSSRARRAGPAESSSILDQYTQTGKRQALYIPTHIHTSGRSDRRQSRWQQSQSFPTY